MFFVNCLHLLKLFFEHPHKTIAFSDEMSKIYQCAHVENICGHRAYFVLAGITNTTKHCGLAFRK